METYENLIEDKSWAEADEKFEAALRNVRFGANKPKLNRFERELLEFCHNTDMKTLLREEFGKHQIELDTEGNLIGSNPFSEAPQHDGNIPPYTHED